jgi:MFS family permease
MPFYLNSSLFAGPLTSVFGRKRLVIFGNILFVGGALMMALSPDSTMAIIMVGRVIVGLAMGKVGLIYANPKGWHL